MKAIMTIGVAGCGKSTFADKLKDRFLEINLDECRDLVNGDASDNSNPAEVAGYRDNLIELAAMNGSDIIISDTNINKHFRELLLDKLKELGFDVTLVHINTPLDKCLEFNSQRSRQVPEDVMHTMHTTLQNQIADGHLKHPAIKRFIRHNPLSEPMPDL